MITENYQPEAPATPDQLANIAAGAEKLKTMVEMPADDTPAETAPVATEIVQTGPRSFKTATTSAPKMAPDVARDLHRYVLDEGGAAAVLGRPVTEADYQEFAARFKGRITDEQIASLIEWHRGLAP